MNPEFPPDLFQFWSLALGRVSLQAALTIGVLLLLELAIPWLNASWKNWLWRLTFLKLAVVIVVPAAMSIPLIPARAASQPTPVEITSAVGLNVVTKQIVVSDIEELTQPKSPFSFGKILLWSSFTIWCGVVIGRFSVLIAQFIRVHRLICAATPVRDPAMIAILNRVAQDMGLKSLPALKLADQIHSPMLGGFFRPCILWPKSLLANLTANNCDADDLRMGLAHEMSHCVRRDLAWNLLASIVESLLWFHPLVWVASGKYSAAMESACDDLAMSGTQISRARFADLLIRISQRSPSYVLSPAGVPLFGGRGKHILRERLTNMQTGRNSLIRQRIAAIALAVGIVASSLPWTVGYAQTSSNSTQIKKKESKSSSAKSSSSSSSTATENGGKTDSSTSTETSGGGTAFGFASGNASGTASGSGQSFGGGSGNSGGTGQSSGSAGSSGQSSSSGFTKSFSSQSSSVSSSGPDSKGSKSALGRAQKSKSGKSQESNSNNGVQMSVSREKTDEGEEIRVTVQEKLRDIQLRESKENGIEVFIRPTKKNPDQTITNVSVQTADELKEKHPEAYKVYRKYMLEEVKKDKSADASEPKAKSDGSQEADANPAQELAKKHLKEMLESDETPAEVKPQIRKMLEEMSKSK